MEKDRTSYYRKKPIREVRTDVTMYDNVLQLNKKNMDSNAIEFLKSKITYRELFERVDKLANAFFETGVRQGDSIGIISITMPTVQESLLACSKLGATSVWLDLRTKENDLIRKINELGCKKLIVFDEVLPMVQMIVPETDVNQILVVSPKDYLNPLIKVFANLKDKKEGKTKNLPLDSKYKYYNDFINEASNNSIFKPAHFELERPSIIVQSSGSTGVSKSIVHTEFNFNESMRKESYCDLPLTCGNTMHISVPPFIIYGLNNSVYASLVFGLNGFMTPFLTEDTVFRDLGKFDMSCGVPFQYKWIYNKMVSLMTEIDEAEKNNDFKTVKRVYKELNEIRKKLKQTRLFITGGDKVTSDELLAWQQLFEVPVINGYGNNEVVGAAVITPAYASKPDAIGIPLKDTTIAAFDVETNDRLIDGEQGELCIQLENAFVKYVNNPDETEIIKQLHSDGKMWVHTGDLGYVDQDGYVYVTGRSKRLIRSSAFKIAPITIERVLLNIEQVKDCVVVGVPDDELKEVPMAFVELQEDYQNKSEEVEEMIKQKFSTDLPDYEIPKYIKFRKIPYNNGKQAFSLLEEEGRDYVENLKENIRLQKRKND